MFRAGSRPGKLDAVEQARGSLAVVVEDLVADCKDRALGMPGRGVQDAGITDCNA